jgi:NAD(P)-dependent dehydrogenase (short-subunit alcohol dehydrogenase family)
MHLQNQSAIITGGASGMGAAMAQRLSKLGAKITLLDLNITKAEQLAKELGGLAVACDVTNEASVQAALAQAQAAHGDIRILINCAGILHSRRMVNQQGPMPLDEYEKVMRVNVVGTFNVMRLTAAAMIPSPLLPTGERGVIINIASVAAYEGQIGQTAYSASKGAIIGMILPAARELAQFGIRVMGIAPGLVNTPMFEQLSPDAKLKLSEAVPFPKRLAEPDEVAMLAQQIIENCMLNGDTIRLDGAIRLQPK